MGALSDLARLQKSPAGRECHARPRTPDAPDGWFMTSGGCASRTRPKGSLGQGIATLAKGVAAGAAVLATGGGALAIGTSLAAAVRPGSSIREVPPPLPGGTMTNGATVASLALPLTQGRPGGSGYLPAAMAAAGGTVGTISRVAGVLGDLFGSNTGGADRACPAGTFKGPLGTCVDLMPGGSTRGGGIFIGGGDPILGLYGAGLSPTRENRTVNACPSGYLLGKDEVCYRRGSISKKERKWNPGARPPITGGDVQAIRRAERARARVMRLGRGVGLYVAAHRPKPAGPPKRKR